MCSLEGGAIVQKMTLRMNTKRPKHETQTIRGPFPKNSRHAKDKDKTRT